MNQDNDKFNVYVGAMGVDPITKENSTPLGASEAVKLAVDCTRRVAMTEVRIVCVNDDTIAFQWKEGTVLFPR